MARIFTTPASEAAAKAWMHDVMVISGILPKSQRTENEIYFTFYSIVPVTEARKICDELINREFSDVDSEIRYLSQFEFYTSFNSSAKKTKYQPEAIAKAIVFMAENFGLYWDDTNRTPYEVNAFKQTLLGEAVYKYGRYISAIKDSPAKAQTKATGSGTSRSGSAPKNDFKQQGPKSSVARGLIGTPGEKVYVQDSYALAIRGNKAGVSSKLFAQIKPLDPKGASGSTNKVFFSASHSYGMGICYFDDMADATAFYDKLVKSGIVPDDVTDLEIGRIKKDKNGYFLFDTEFGICAISASVLNEDLQTPVEEDLGSGWRKATANYTKEQLAELHDYMRR